MLVADSREQAAESMVPVSPQAEPASSRSPQKAKGKTAPSCVVLGARACVWAVWWFTGPPVKSGLPKGSTAKWEGGSEKGLVWG